ncbi:MAG: DegT/DnrJ/EryC1/StrS family aminotransferase [Planctomycetota bacterium]|nr:DegT/DnrJ/EryC1/StrS family aminotransferase [Planctomycetota bacterium]
MRIGPCDEVITVPNSFIVTAKAISFCDATAVFVGAYEQIENVARKTTGFIERSTPTGPHGT